MEKLKVKHDHTLTDIIKVGIFALFLILPILVFLPNCLYYGFNEHATNTETTTINYKYQSNEVNTLNDLVIGNLYHLDSLNIQYSQDTTLNFSLNIVSGLFDDFEYTDEPLYDYDFTNYEVLGNLFLSIDSDNLYIQFQNNSLVAISFNYVNITDVIFSISYQNDNSFNDYLVHNDILPSYTDFNVIESVSVNTDDTITDKVAYAWQRMWETPMLNWTNNNSFKFTINAFTNVFGITPESKMANYLTYLLVITCIYLVFDIVLTLTTKLTHLINAK